MFRLNLRIGDKLLISAGLGIAVMAGLAINDALDRSARNVLAGEARDGQTVQVAAVDASVALHRLVIVNRDIRLAAAPAEIDVARRQAAAYTTEGLGALDRAIAVASGAERQQLGTARDLLGQYSAAIGESADAQKKIDELRDSLGEEARKWAASVNAVLALPALKAETYRHDIMLALERANALTAGARAAIAANFIHRTDDAKTQIKAALDAAYKAIRESSANVGDDGVTERIEALQRFLPRYQAAFDDTLAAIARQEAVLRDRADPARARLHTILDDTGKALSLRAAEREAAVVDHESRSQTIARAGELAVALVLIGSALFARFNVGRPIRRIGDVLRQLADGDKSVEIPYARRTDEIGETARAATAFKDNIAQMERLEAEHKQTEVQARAARKAEMHRLADGFEAAIGMVVNNVSAASNQLEAAAATLTRTAATTQELVGIVAGASDEASSNVQTVAAAADELSTSVNEISRQVQESTTIAGEAVKQAQKTDARIAALSQAASRIGDVVKLITAIAEQTNLLALNATIEAARAGAAGRGFAVVAQEVKSLAAQTAKATEEIGSQITGMQAATHESVAAIKEIGGTIGRIAGIAGAIAAAVEEQGVSTQEIARNVQQAAHGTSQVAVNIADVRKGAGETGSASTQVLSSARALSTEGNRLKAEVDRFIATVRAA